MAKKESLYPVERQEETQGAAENEDHAVEGKEPPGSREENGEPPRAASARRRGLGRGLDALFGSSLEDDAWEISDGSKETGPRSSSGTAAGPDGLERDVVGLDEITPNPDQPRRDFNEESIAELAESIARHGLLQPILVRPRFDGDNGYEIIAGERRWRACQKAGLHSVPVVIHDMGDERSLEIALIENLQREDLNAMDEALGYKKLMEDFEKTQAEVAEIIGKSRPHIANMLRLVTLPDSVKEMIRKGDLSAGHARTLVGSQNPEKIARIIIDRKLSVRAAEQLAQEQNRRDKEERQENDPAQDMRESRGLRTSGEKRQKDADTRRLEDEVSNLLGMKVDILMQGKGGRLSIHFDDLDSLDDLLHRLTRAAAEPGRY